jgi:hypothetical protein
LAGEQKKTVWVKIRPLEEMFAILDFGSFWKILKMGGKSLPHPVGVFFILPSPPKYNNIQQKHKNH